MMSYIQPCAHWTGPAEIRQMKSALTALFLCSRPATIQCRHQRQHMQCSPTILPHHCAEHTPSCYIVNINN